MNIARVSYRASWNELSLVSEYNYNNVNNNKKKRSRFRRDAVLRKIRRDKFKAMATRYRELIVSSSMCRE